MKRWVAVFGVVALTAAGCATMDDATRTKTEGTAVGAGAGAVLGALLGNVIGGGNNTLVGAAIGAAVGGTAGYLYGSHVATQKAKYAKSEDWLDACIANAQKVNGETRTYNAAIGKEIKELDAETQELARAYQAKKVQKNTLSGQRKELDGKMAEAGKQLEKAKFELKHQEQVVAAAKAEGQGARAAQLDKEIAELKQLIAELEGHTETLASMSAKMTV